MLRTHCLEQQENWPDLLPAVMMTMRMTPASQGTTLSPFHMLFGTHMKCPYDVNVLPTMTLPINAQTQMNRLITNLEIAKSVADAAIQTSSDRNREQYDRYGKVPIFKTGDKVLITQHNVPKNLSYKLYNKFTGPFYIVRECPNYTYERQSCLTHKLYKGRIHSNRLRKYWDPEGRVTYLPAPQGEPDNVIPVEVNENEVAQNDRLVHQNDGADEGTRSLEVTKCRQNQVYNQGLYTVRPKVSRPAIQGSCAVVDSRLTSMDVELDGNTKYNNASSANTPLGRVPNDSPLAGSSTSPLNSDDRPCDGGSKSQASKSSRDKWCSIECLAGIKTITGVRHYKVIWADGSHAQWIPAIDVADEAIREYHIKNSLKGKRRKK